MGAQVDDAARIAIAAFEPFGGRAVNRSWQLASALAAPPGVDLTLTQLPVSFAALPAAVATLVAAAAGARGLVLMGESSAARGLEIERVALNLIDARIDDNRGQRPSDQPVVAGGPAGRFATAPVRALLTAAQAAGAPVALSLSAGSFACNAAYYLALSEAPASLPVVFIHVPDGSAPDAAAPLLQGLAAIVAVLASQPRAG